MSTEVFIAHGDLARLPPVCVASGEPADGRMAATYPKRPLGALVILAVLGPIGIAAIALYLRFRGTIDLELPYTQKAFDKVVQREQLRARTAVFGTIAFLLGLLLFRFHVPAALVCMGVAVLSYALFAYAAWSLGLLQPEVRANRDGVRLIGVDPAFVSAVEARRTP